MTKGNEHGQNMHVYTTHISLIVVGIFASAQAGAILCYRLLVFRTIYIHNWWTWALMSHCIQARACCIFAALKAPTL